LRTQIVVPAGPYVVTPVVVKAVQGPYVVTEGVGVDVDVDVVVDPWGTPKILLRLVMKSLSVCVRSAGVWSPAASLSAMPTAPRMSRLVLMVARAVGLMSNVGLRVTPPTAMSSPEMSITMAC